jgi:HSP20 family molecular chaperone IbpA
MTSSTLIPIIDDKNRFLKSPNRYSIHDFGQGYRTYSYEFDLVDYEPEQITVLLDNNGRLRIRARRPPCHEFRREYNLGGPNIETRLVRNTMDTFGHVRVDVEARPRQNDTSSIDNNILTFDLQGYRPKNITVRINEHGLLKITAQHTDDVIGHRINREYYRQYQLPEYMNRDHIRAKLDENQILTIQLPQPLPKIKQSWQPYYDRDSMPGYGNSCCCVM